MGMLSEYRTVNRLLKKKQAIVFYAESRHYYPYFQRLLQDLVEARASIVYITSDPKDPLLQQALPSLEVVYVKWMLAFLFSRLRADVMVLTMPDLDNFIFKRSGSVDRYVYVFHAAVSIHQQYRKQAFDHYDTIFCNGQYQVRELLKAEELYGLRAKELFAYGYPLLDTLRKKASLHQRPDDEQAVVLVAPSWFPGCIFDTCFEDLLTELSALPYKIIIRAHPEYIKRNKKGYQRVLELVKKKPQLVIDTEPSVIERLPTIDYLVTDRSGIALEFAIGCGKPVLLIDTALKQTNPDWRELAIEPLENSIRPGLGVRLEPSQLKELPTAFAQLDQLGKIFPATMENFRKELFFNSEENYLAGRDYLLGLVVNG